MSTRLFRILSIVITTIVLVCVPQAAFAGAGHGGGGGFHGGGGGFGGGFHGGMGGMGGFHGGSGGWHGPGVSGGWHGSGGGWSGWGHPGWSGWGHPGWPYYHPGYCCGWGGGWGFSVGINLGWGWGYPYAYGYPYPYYYPYYPYYYPYYGPYGYPPPQPPPSSDPGRDKGNAGDPRDNAWQHNSDAPAPAISPDTNNVLTIKAPKAPTRITNYRTVATADAAQRQEVRNVIRALQAMPPEARRRQVESGRYRNLAPEEQELVRRVALTSSSVVATR